MFRLIIGVLVGLALGFGLITLLSKQPDAGLEPQADTAQPS